MVKKSLLMLVLVAVVAGGAFAQTDEQTDFTQTDSAKTGFAAMPKNTITVDIGPLIVGLGFSKVVNAFIDSDSNASADGFGLAGQYERQLMNNFGVGLRFAWLETGFNSKQLSLKFTSYSIEGHARWYPGDTFFLDGMLGFANLSMFTEGRVELDETSSEYGSKVTISETFSRGFFKMGVKIGWRIDFGRPGGFVFEPSIGYSQGFSPSPTFGDQLSDYIKKEFDGAEINAAAFALPFLMAENLVFVGGPRLSLAFGWRF